MSFSILVVDDSDVMRSIIRRVLGISGIDIGNVFEAGNGAEALRVMEQKWVDVVLTDINMPVMSGVELMAHMRESETFAATPVIVISTEGRDDRIEKIMNAGASGYITKPFRPEDVAKTIYKALGANPDERFIKEPEDSDF
jgi:two-component system, chemotaxis family, chemotaxis protein CheY